MTTPFLAGEPDSLGYTTRDSLLTIQGFAPKEATDRRKVAAATAVNFSDIVSRPASAQAQYFLNVFFDNLSAADKSKVYSDWQVFCVQQKENGLTEDGPTIPQNLANLFLQRLGQTMTPTEFKASFKEVDSNFDGKMAYLEYLVWTFSGSVGSPANAIFRPQVQSQPLFNAIKKCLAAERALLAYADDLKAKEEAAASLTGVKGTRAKNELATFKENTNLAGLNADQANAYEKLIKARSSLTERGTEFWNSTVADEATSRLPQKAQK